MFKKLSQLPLFKKLCQKIGEHRQLTIHRSLCRANRNGGEKETVSFAEKHYMFSSLIRRIRGSACREIATYLVNLVHYCPSDALFVAEDLTKNIGDSERHRMIVTHIKKNTRHPDAAALLLAEIRALP